MTFAVNAATVGAKSSFISKLILEVAVSSFRILLIILVCSLTVACKIEIVVPEGGSVRSDSGAYICSSDQKCTVDVVDAFFQETFRAIPDEGYEFTNW